MSLRGVKLTQRIGDGTPSGHRASALSQKTPNLATQAWTRQREATRWHQDETADDPSLVADHTGDGLARRIENERPQTGPIRANPSLGPGTMNCDIHRIVPERQRERVEKLSTLSQIGIGNRFVYHPTGMLTGTLPLVWASGILERWPRQADRKQGHLTRESLERCPNPVGPNPCKEVLV